MRVLLTGAKGFIGSRLLTCLCEAGHHVRVVTRTVFKCDFESVEVVHADLTSADVDYDALLSGCDVVFNCAGEIRDEKLMRSLHVDATELMVLAANRLATRERPVHFVQLSSVGAYGPAQGAVRLVDELTIENPKGPYEETKTIADSLVVKNRGNEFYSYAILRPSNVFGKSMSNNSLRQLGRFVSKGKFFYVGNSKKTAIATYVHVDDVVAALMLCGFDVRSKCEVFNISNDCAFSDMINGIADAQGVARPKWSFPEAPLRLMISILNLFFRLPVTQERIDALVARTSYPSTKMQRVFGFKPEREVPIAVAELFEENR
ncbi:NAD(P)-dependent oxidoreductase [Pseudomonas sp. 681]|jgi:nucleoside-diphosphate-sugar epimerase|uniref:NAD(P)-dependent oxidoreductase n=1 Tax=Pseudomonas fungipugnans TaxID=3024217 RepID=A0ABT6QK58_9PSED|nr:NAD(P)-dependent oxidoreductase [Pseudomonas sp. 681]MDI2591267.1 NAD(P)-dependent oxidoreductase [Pseudomonas sp. 681]